MKPSETMFQVLVSVEQTGTSLQRFKRKSASTLLENAADSDESKIRHQLLLDLEYCKNWAASFGIEVPQIIEVMARATSTHEATFNTVHSLQDMSEISEAEQN